MTQPRRRASLRLTLSGIISLLVLSTVSVVSLSLIGSRRREAEQELLHKGLLHAEFLAAQLRSAIAFNDRQTTHEVLSSTAELDRDVEGVALYRQDGSLLGATGGSVATPWVVSPERAQLRVSPTTLDALSPVVSREGPRGVVVLRMSRERLTRAAHAALLEAVLIATAAVALALVASWAIAGHVVTRLSRVMVAADEVATGDLTQPPLEPGRGDEIGRLTVSFNVMVAQLRHLIEARQLATARERDKLAVLVSERTLELALRNEDLQRSHERYRQIIETTSAIPWEYDVGEMKFTYVGPQAEKLLGHPLSIWSNLRLLKGLFPIEDWRRLKAEYATALIKKGTFESEFRMIAADGRTLTFRGVGQCTVDEGGRLRGLLLDVTQRKELERELQQAQKLEAVGRLASGVAHEINTPVQFVSDSVAFIQGAFRDTLSLLGQYEKLKTLLEPKGAVGDLLAQITEAEREADLDYLVENVPKALERTVDGLGRVATLVLSMKEFAHPDKREKTNADINRALASTLTIARNEYKYVADIQVDYGEVPPLLCHVSELNQAFLGIIVNAAHAIGEVVSGTEARGVIRIGTRLEGSEIVVTIQDTGGGIPASIRDKIFDPFFTTKPVGKGTGQGLAIARSMIVDKHGGTLSVDSAPGQGSTFIIRLPLAQDTSLPAHAVAA